MRIIKSILVTIGIIAIGESSAFAAVVAIPYINNFESTTIGSAPVDFTNGKSSDQTITTTVETGSNGTNVMHAVITNSNSGSTKALSLVGAGTTFSSEGGFIMSSDFNVLTGSTGNGGYRIGFSALQRDSNPTNSNGGVWAFLNSNGTVALQNTQSGAALSNLTTTSDFGTLVLGATYTASLTGTYVDGNLTLTYTITQTGNVLNGTDLNIGKSATASAIILANQFTGTNFGYALFDGPAAWQGGQTLTVDLDNFSLSAIPEPSTYVLLLVGFAIMLFLHKHLFRKAKT